MKGRFVMIIGPSAAGKTELVKALLARVPGSARLVTMTTRPQRPGELEGVDYHFVDRAEFERRIAAGDLLEHAEVYGNLYGQSKEVLESSLLAHPYVFGIIDVKGAKALKAIMPEALAIFIDPGSLEDLSARLRTIRAGISEAELEKRLATAAEEMASAAAFDAIIQNAPGRFEETIEQAIRLL